MATVSQPKLFKFLLVGLPIGLAVTIVIALGLYYTEPGRNAPSKDGALRFAAPVSESDLKETVVTLSQTVGPRSIEAEPDAMVRARKFAQSSLSADNMGYEVALHSQKNGAANCLSVIAELPGRGRASELIIIAAPYTSVAASPGAARSASGVAAVLSLAKVMTGSVQQRTVQFVAYASSASDPKSYDLSNAVGFDNDFTAIAVLNFDNLAFPVREGGAWEVEVPIVMHTSETALANEVTTKFARGTGLRFTVESVRDSGESERSLLPVLTLVPDLAKSPAGTPADVPAAYDYSRLTQTVKKLHELVLRLANPDSV